MKQLSTTDPEFARQFSRVIDARREADSDVAGAVADTNDGSQSFFVEASTRLNDHITVELEGRFIANTDRTQPAFFSRDDDYLQLQLSYYF